jgi:hypothetical protein
MFKTRIIMGTVVEQIGAFLKQERTADGVWRCLHLHNPPKYYCAYRRETAKAQEVEENFLKKTMLKF